MQHPSRERTEEDLFTTDLIEPEEVVEEVVTVEVDFDSDLTDTVSIRLVRQEFDRDGEASGFQALETIQSIASLSLMLLRFELTRPY